MTGKVLEVEDFIHPDNKAIRITDFWNSWDNMRSFWKRDKEEIRRYVFAIDTTSTSNASLPWKNKTTIPKLCQIRDNLFANYIATLFPQRKNVIWEANESDSNSADKRDAIENYANWVMSQPSFRHEMEKLILDYIDYGNCFSTVEWTDLRVEDAEKTQMGYIGPSVRRINPLDIVFNPTADTFESAPKIVRSITSMGEVKKLLNKLSNDENRESYENLWNYLKEIRVNAATFQGDWAERDNLYRVDGFTSFRDYLLSDSVEILTFYGDLYDSDNDIFLENHVIMVVDRHKLISMKPNPSFFGYPPIFHSAWRKRQDNLWGMGPLDNLVGMQYRIDHVENMKADIFDLVTYPVQKVKGFVEDYTWQPGEKITVSDEGDVEMVVPDVQALQANFEIQNLERLMEEMAGAPKEAMGFRTPGEKTKYEVQRLENASGRLYQNKCYQFDAEQTEKVINAAIELSRRNMTGVNVIKVFDNTFNVASFQALTVEDITGIGRIKPVASKHFAEQAELIQNLTTLAGSNLWPFVQAHFSSVKTAKLIEKMFGLEQYELVMPNIALTEQAESQKHVNALQEHMMQQIDTPTGSGTDFDPEAVGDVSSMGGQPQF